MTLTPGNPAVIFDEPGCDLPGKVLGFLQQEGMEVFREVENFSKVGGCTDKADRRARCGKSFIELVWPCKSTPVLC